MVFDVVAEVDASASWLCPSSSVAGCCVCFFFWAAPSERVNVYLMSSVFICCCCFVIVGFEILKTLGQFDVWGSSVWWCIWLGVFFTISLRSTNLLLSVVSLFDILRRNIAAVALSRLLLLLRRSGEARWRANALNAFIARCSDNYAKVLSIHCISYTTIYVFSCRCYCFRLRFFGFPSSIRLHSVPHPTSDSATLFFISNVYSKYYDSRAITTYGMLFGVAATLSGCCP